jgi:hypothetical protein
MCLVMHVNDSLLNQNPWSADGFNGESLQHMSEVHLMGLLSMVNCVICNDWTHYLDLILIEDCTAQ